jgi:hypothetical protein
MIPTRDFIVLLVVAFVTCTTAILIRTSTTTASVSAAVPFIQDNALLFDSIQAITIQKNGRLISMERKNREWWQVKPFLIRLDSSSMHRLIKAVQGVQQLGELESESSDDTIGLG